MNRNTMKLRYLAILGFLVFTLSGCKFRENRVQSTNTPAQSSQQPSHLVTPQATYTAITRQIAPTATQPSITTKETAPVQTTNGLEQKLTTQINNLDAANQAGDSLENLP